MRPIADGRSPRRRLPAAGQEPDGGLAVAEAGEELADRLTRLLGAAAGDGPVPTPAVACASLAHQRWRQPRRARTATAARRRLAAAVADGDADTAAAAWSTLARTVERDRAAAVAHHARRHRLTARPTGRAPLFPQPVCVHQRRAAWEIYPLAALHGIDLPESVHHTLAGWHEADTPLAAYYLADEQPLALRDRLATPTLVSAVARASRTTARGLAPAATAVGGAMALTAAPLAWLAGVDPVLFGVVTGDGHVGTWFELHRWYHP